MEHSWQRRIDWAKRTQGPTTCWQPASTACSIDVQFPTAFLAFLCLSVEKRVSKTKNRKPQRHNSLRDTTASDLWTHILLNIKLSATALCHSANPGLHPWVLLWQCFSDRPSASLVLLDSKRLNYNFVLSLVAGFSGFSGFADDATIAEKSHSLIDFFQINLPKTVNFFSPVKCLSDR